MSTDLFGGVSAAEKAAKAMPSGYITLTDWKDKALAEVPKVASGKKFNRQGDNKEDSMGNIEWAAWSWNPVTGCKHDCSYCLSGDTLILMADGSAKPLRDIKVSDRIIGTEKSGTYRRFKETQVLAHWQTRKQAFEITLADGRKIVSSGDHRFMTERGWKFAQPAAVGQRPFLTTNNSMIGIGALAESALESTEYMRGYISGIVRGDGHFKKHKDSRRANSYMHQFRLALMDESATERTARYLESFGVSVCWFDFHMKRTVRAIRTSTKKAFEQIGEIMKPLDDLEYLRGFIAGIFDAEGTNNGNKRTSALRMFNSSEEILSLIEKALTLGGFGFVYDKDKKTANKVVRTIRITGGIADHLRFFQWCNMAIRRKCKIDGAAIKNNQDMRIVEINPLGVEMDMFDITTGTEDFIANGVVAHNCYARDIAQRFYPQGFEPTLHPDRLAAPYNTKVPACAKDDIAKRNVFANSMSDLYGRWVPQEWIDAVFKAMADNPQWNFLTLTKFPKRAAELVYPKNVWIGTSVDLQVRVKPAEEAFSRIECGVRWLSIEPMLEPLTFSRPEVFDWVVIGGASKSNKTPEWIPPSSWIVRVASQFLDANPKVKIYLKTNGRPREFPGSITADTAPEAFRYLGQS